MGKYKLINADCLEAMTRAKPESVDAIVTDPPYGLAFMGKQWDHGVPGAPFWQAALRVAKPGAHLLAFGGTRTYHRLACAIEDAGWEIRDCLMWVYGSGFPKSLDVSKAIDKAAGAEREVVGVSTNGSGAQPNKLSNHTTGDTGIGYADGSGKTFNITAPATEAAKQWEGWGTALKPAFEPIILARKPFPTTVAANVLEHGTGGLNIDGCRVEANGDKLGGGRVSTTTEGWDRPWKHDSEAVEACKARGDAAVAKAEQLGRWPANFIHDGSDEATGLLGDAARFFYCAKASRADRDAGCDNLPLKECGMMEDDNYPIKTGSGNLRETKRKNVHPTVKPTDLMQYLCRLITPPGGVILDPFMGSGSTGKAAMLEGFRFIGIEKEAEYLEIAKARIEFALSTGKVK